MNYRLIAIVFLVAASFYACTTGHVTMIDTGSEKIFIKNSSDNLWEYEHGKMRQAFAPPVFEIEGQDVPGVFETFTITSRKLSASQVEEFTVTGPLRDMPDVTMNFVIRKSDKNSIVRFRYHLYSENDIRLTKSEGSDRLSYLKTPVGHFSDFREITLSTFHVLKHAYQIEENVIGQKALENELTLMGPIFIAGNGKKTLIITYEHGSQLPDRYLQYELSNDNFASLVAVKGNYFNGQLLNTQGGYHSIWMNVGLIDGGVDEAARQHRAHVLHHTSENPESRQPYIFYNTWNYQERNFNWYDNPYLHDMNLARMLDEIDIAARMGIEVFVVDAGWFGKTGDWIASSIRFPDDLEQVKAKLDSYGIHMGLWFNADAAVTSEMLERNRENVMSYNGKIDGPHQVWETEESYRMCLVSSFGDEYADELIRVAKKYGVKYFKWDAFRQYGCNSPDHWHGDESHSAEERAHNYSFQLPIAMTNIADKISAAIPGAIVDFDVTEGQRAMGLGFLSAGKYFAINNGPYYWSLDDPQYSPGGGMGANVLVFPGLARAINARSILNYDKWIPSILFLTHYLPDDPEFSQWVNIGSMVLGQNGIWGDLLTVSDEGIGRYGEALSNYKQVRGDIVNSFPVRSGVIGGTPEIHEKIDPQTGKGAVVIFNNYQDVWNKNAEKDFAGTFTYVTENAVNQNFWCNETAQIDYDSKGRARITVEFEKPGARIIFFGVE
jgi:alpha-galactosidase